MDYLTTTTELASVANAIRSKGGTSGSLTYPDGFILAINNIDINPVELTVSNATASKISGTTDDYLMEMT